MTNYVCYSDDTISPPAKVYIAYELNKDDLNELAEDIDEHSDNIHLDTLHYFKSYDVNVRRLCNDGSVSITLYKGIFAWKERVDEMIRILALYDVLSPVIDKHFVFRLFETCASNKKFYSHRYHKWMLKNSPEGRIKRKDDIFFVPKYFIKLYHVCHVQTTWMFIRLSENYAAVEQLWLDICELHHYQLCEYLFMDINTYYREEEVDEIIRTTVTYKCIKMDTELMYPSCLINTMNAFRSCYVYNLLKNGKIKYFIGAFNHSDKVDLLREALD